MLWKALPAWTLPPERLSWACEEEDTGFGLMAQAFLRPDVELPLPYKWPGPMMLLRLAGGTN